eukprot:11018172-Ditylum_brightwellii.AAC.1
MRYNITLIAAATQYRLKTALGESEEYYSHCEVFPIYESGQGTTNSPNIWLCISSSISDICEESAPGTEFISPVQIYSVLLAILGCMDEKSGQYVPRK